MSIRKPLYVEELEFRDLPSIMPLPPPAAPCDVSHVGVHSPEPRHETHHKSHHALHGTGEGTYTGASLIVDAGESNTLQGNAILGKMGHVKVTGAVHGLGNIATGHASGTLTFTNSHGSVTIELTGPEQTGFSPLPQTYHYLVIAATGAYRHLHDQGTLHLTFQAALAPVTPAGQFPPAPHGTFVLTIPKL